MRNYFLGLFFLLSALLPAQELSERMHQFIDNKDSFWWNSFENINRRIYLPEARKSLADSPGDILLIPGQKALSPVTIFNIFHSLKLDRQDKVMVAGYSAAYEAALMAEAGLKVFLIQESLPLPEGQKYSYIQSGGEDFYEQWLAESPFDAIFITSPQQEVDPKLLEQIKIGAYMVVPLKTPGGINQWVRIQKTEGSFMLEVLGLQGEVP